MLKTIMAAAAVSTLALANAMAQATMPPAGSAPAATTQGPPAATTQVPAATTQAPAATPAPTTSPAASAPARTPTPTAATSTAGSAKFVTKQTSDQWLASKFSGTDVIGTDDKKIGDVSDVLFDKDKKILAYIVGVGGFLGIGAKDVAIDPASFQTVPGSGNDNFKLRLSMTRDELTAAPAFELYRETRPATSQAPATRPMGAPAPTTTAPAPKQ